MAIAAGGGTCRAGGGTGLDHCGGSAGLDHRGAGAGLNHRAGHGPKSRAAAGPIAGRNADKYAAENPAMRMKAFTRQVSGTLAALSRRH
jgi:hypothetical protein